MAVTFADKLARMPHYEAGMHLEEARETYASNDIVKLASNECPWPPHPAVLEVIAGEAASAHRYPDQHARLLRRRIAERYDFDPGGIAVGNGSCEILLAAAVALCEPEAEIVFAWPAFSIYPHLAALSGAREIRVPLSDDYLHDLEAMLAEVTAATQLLVVCNPNNPTGTHLPAAEIGAYVERVPDHVTVVLDEAYVEFQVHDDVDATVDLLKRFPNLVVLRTFSKVYGLAGLRVGYGLGSARFRSAVHAVRQPFPVNALAQAAAAEAILHQDEVTDRVERTVAERLRVEEELHELGLRTADTHANFSWVALGDRDEAALIEALGRAGVIVRGGESLGGPGHIRVTYGTRAENERFVEALRGAL
ncbi:MAG: histidinol-phosphate transaminase [Solirubrobacterales bacterium]